MSRPRLWVASELYYPEETSTGYFLTRIAEGLTPTFDVRVISGRPAYSERGVAVTRDEVKGGATIHRVGATRFDKDRLALRILNLVTFSVGAFFYALGHIQRGDRVLVVTNPPTLPLVLMLAGKLRGAGLTLLVHDIYPDVLAATRMMDRGGLTFRALDAGAAWLLRRFGSVVVLGRDMAELIGAKPGVAHERIVIIPNWADLDLIRPADRDGNALRRDLGLESKFVVQFSGNIGRTHDLAAVVSAAERLRQREDIHFLLAGYGGKLSAVGEDIRRRGLTNVTILPRQPRERLSTMLACSDLTVIALVADMFGISVPSRMYNVMAAGVAIAAIADPRSELARVVKENNAGWVLPEGGDGLAALVEQLAGDPRCAVARARGENGRSRVERTYTLERVIADYTLLLVADRR